MATNKRQTVSNDKNGVWNPVHEYLVGVQGAFTASAAARFSFVAKTSGVIDSFVGAVLKNGSDATNPLQTAFDLKKNGTTVLTTQPAITKAAAADTRVSTNAAGTGITQAVIKTDGSAAFAAGDIFEIDFTITRTASPTTEIQSPFASIGVIYNRDEPTAPLALGDVN